MTRSLAAMTSSRNDAASNGAPRRDRPEFRIFGTMVDAGSGCYLRTRDLPRLIALWPHELADRKVFADPVEAAAGAQRRAAARPCGSLEL